MIIQKLSIPVILLSSLLCLTSAVVAMEQEATEQGLKRSESGEKELEIPRSPRLGSPRKLSGPDDTINNNSSKKTFSLLHWASLKGYANHYFFNGWGPTLTLLGGLGIYCVKNDRKAPLHAASWMKDSFKEMPWYLKCPGLLLGSCLVYSYYKPRVNNSYHATLNYLRSLKK